MDAVEESNGSCYEQAASVPRPQPCATTPHDYVNFEDGHPSWDFCRKCQWSRYELGAGSVIDHEYVQSPLGGAHCDFVLVELKHGAEICGRLPVSHPEPLPGLAASKPEGGDASGSNLLALLERYQISVAPDQSMPGMWAAYRGDFAPLSARAKTPGEAILRLVVTISEDEREQCDARRGAK